MTLNRVDGGQEVMFGQRDYGGTRLGLCDGIDRGLYGCYTTSVAMMLRHYGYDTDPGRLDELLTMGLNGNAGDPGSWRPIYVDGCAMVDDSAEQVTGGQVKLVSIDTYNDRPADINSFSMADDEEIIIGIDGSAYFGYPTHFLRVYSWNGTTLLAADPWNKARVDVEATFATPFGWDLRRLVIKTVKHKLPGFVPAWKQQPTPAPQPQPEPAPQPAQGISDTPTPGTTVTVIFSGRVFAGDAMFYDRPDGNPMNQFAPVGQLTFWQGAYDGVNWWDRVSSDGGPRGDWWILDSKVDLGGQTPARLYNATQLPLNNLPAAPYPLNPELPPTLRRRKLVTGSKSAVASKK